MAVEGMSALSVLCTSLVWVHLCVCSWSRVSLWCLLVCFMYAEEKKDRQGETQGWGSLQQVEIPFSLPLLFVSTAGLSHGQTFFFPQGCFSYTSAETEPPACNGTAEALWETFTPKSLQVWVMKEFHLPTFSNINGANSFFPLWELLERPKRDKNLAIQLTMDKKWNPTKKTTHVN